MLFRFWVFPDCTFLDISTPRVETTHKLGNTTYVVNGIYASKGATATEKIKRLLDRETKK